MGRLAEPPVHPLPAGPRAAVGPAGPADLSPAVRAVLIAAEAETDPMSDDDRAFEMAFRLVGSLQHLRTESE